MRGSGEESDKSERELEEEEGEAEEERQGEEQVVGSEEGSDGESRDEPVLRRSERVHRWRQDLDCVYYQFESLFSSTTGC